MKNNQMKKWVDYEFESASYRTEEFNEFVKDFRKFVILELKQNFNLVSFSIGHFEISFFVESLKTKKMAYASISDVRFFKNSWFDNVLIRTAKSKVDYTGGSNNYCKLEEINDYLLRLTD